MAVQFRGNHSNPVACCAQFSVSWQVRRTPTYCGVEALLQRFHQEQAATYVAVRCSFAQYSLRLKKSAPECSYMNFYAPTTLFFRFSRPLTHPPRGRRALMGLRWSWLGGRGGGNEGKRRYRTHTHTQSRTPPAPPLMNVFLRKTPFAFRSYPSVRPVHLSRFLTLRACRLRVFPATLMRRRRWWCSSPSVSRPPPAGTGASGCGPVPTSG